MGDVGEVAVIAKQTTEIYSNALGFGAAAAAQKKAFSTRSFKVARACAGFCHCCSASLSASAIGSRTIPLLWSIQPTLFRASGFRRAQRLQRLGAFRRDWLPSGAGVVYWRVFQTSGKDQTDDDHGCRHGKVLPQHLFSDSQVELISVFLSG